MARVDPKSFEYQARCFSCIVGRTDDKETGEKSTTVYFRVPSYSEVGPEYRERVVGCLRSIFPSMERVAENVSGDNRHEMFKVVTQGEAREFFASIPEKYAVAMKPIMGDVAGIWAKALEKFVPTFEQKTPDEVDQEKLSEFLSRNREVKKVKEELDQANGMGGAPEVLRKKYDDAIKEQSLVFATKMSDADFRSKIDNFIKKAFVAFGAPFVTQRTDALESTFRPMMSEVFGEKFPERSREWEKLGVMNTLIFGSMPFPIRGEQPAVNLKDDSFIVKIPWLQYHNSAEEMDGIAKALSEDLGLKTIETMDFKEGRQTFKPANGGYLDPNGLDRTWNLAMLGHISVAVESLRKKYPALNPYLNKYPVHTTLNIAYHAVNSINKNVTCNEDCKGYIKPDANTLQPPIFEVLKSIESRGASTSYEKKKEERREKSETREREMIREDRVLAWPSKKLVYIQLLGPTHEKVGEAIREFSVMTKDKGVREVNWEYNKKYDYWKTNVILDGKDFSGYENRRLFAEKLVAFVKEKTGVEIPLKSPNQFNIEWNHGQTKERMKVFNVRLPKPFGMSAEAKKLAGEFGKKKGEGFSPEVKAIEFIRSALNSEGYETQDSMYKSLRRVPCETKEELSDCVTFIESKVAEANEKFGSSIGVFEYDKTAEQEKRASTCIKGWRDKERTQAQEKDTEFPVR